MELDELFKNQGNFTEDDVRKIIEQIGYSDEGMDIDSEEDWDEEMMDAYAEYIKNYWYTYKDIAKSVDPNIDTETEHYGPMAQDIEKVNPACVHETEDGVKTVDAARLAMMNAGMIADVIRRLDALEERLDKEASSGKES